MDGAQELAKPSAERPQRKLSHQGKQTATLGRAAADKSSRPPDQAPPCGQPVVGLGQQEGEGEPEHQPRAPVRCGVAEIGTVGMSALDTTLTKATRDRVGRRQWWHWPLGSERC